VKTVISTDRTAAVELLRRGEIVALPTETVYGLAANALNPIAVAKIFEAKERPRFDPLIVHLPNREWLEKITDLPTHDRELVFQLAARFWPGPFTMVLPRREIVPDIVTAGLDTVAVRISAHPVFADIVCMFGKPLAAPSANRFGRISPTTAQHVLHELDGRILLIIDGGPTEHGIESTIVAVRNGRIKVLRRGPITAEQLRGLGFQPSEVIGRDADATGGARGIGFQPMDPNEDVQIRYGTYLPHWTQEHATYAVTFRLADALPAKVIADWEYERHDTIERARRQNRELTDAEQRRLAKLFSDKLESYLDAGHGECWLRDKRIAKVVTDALLHFDGERYELFAWCVMPNHVHVVLRPTRGHTLSDILHTWKSFTAQRVNRLLHREGKFWQPEPYDHLIRDERDLRNQVRYVIQNPTKAGLKAWQWVGRGSGLGFQPSKVIGRDADGTSIRAPGQLPSHYAPKTALRLVDNAEAFWPQKNQRVGLLAWNPVGPRHKFAAVRTLSERHDLREAAANLFRCLRELDALDVNLIVAERVPSEGLGAAIMDRLTRAATTAD
jgi:tRNA threonylcarbamoyl adenosine modification protein (Sua5/YciO/YrdC/YwlC family)